MPLTSLYLVSLDTSTTISSFIPLLLSSIPQSAHPLLIARPLRWIIEPWINSPTAADVTALKTLTTNKWDLLILFPSVVDPLPAHVSSQICELYTLRVGIPSKLVSSFLASNASLLHPPPNSVPELTGSLEQAQSARTSKDLELTHDIRRWLENPTTPKTAPTMLNLLTFLPDKHESYKAYGQAFASSVGIRRGGIAKIAGSVPRQSGKELEHVWDEVALAHYPTVWHFADMVASKDYQDANARFRVGALRGTTILCCDELDKDVLRGLEAAKDKSKI